MSMLLGSINRLALAGIFALATNAAANAEIVVGVVVSQSGPVSSIGLPYMKGTLAGQTFVGEAAGEKFRIIMLDDASDPSNASKYARKLIEEDHVDVLLGSAGSPSTGAIIAVASELKVPMIAIAPVGGAPKVDGKTWAICVVQPPSDMVGIVVDYIAKTQAKNIGYIGFSDAWGDLVYNNLLKSGEPQGLKVTTNERYARADTSVTSQVLKLSASKPDAVMIGGSGTAGALPYTALADRGYKGPIYSTPAVINPDFVRLAGASADGTIVSAGPITVVTQLPDGHPNKAVGLAFRDAYAKANGSDLKDNFSAYAFDGWLVMADAAKRTVAAGVKPGTPEFRSALRDAIHQTKEVVGANGIYNYGEDSFFGTDRRALVLVKLEKGEWKFFQ
jgi:branched-chain amino acid transport system substrate-binding protein